MSEHESAAPGGLPGRGALVWGRASSAGAQDACQRVWTYAVVDVPSAAVAVTA
jgi:hypothetical protein